MILVTGATGKVGSEVVKGLVARGAAVRALVRQPEKAKGWTGVEVVQGDLSQAASVAAALRGVEVLFLLTNANAAQETTVLDEAVRAGVKRVVKLSALGADSDSTMLIRRAHGTVEAKLQAGPLQWTILRPGMFAQNFLNHAESIRVRGEFRGSYGEGKVAPIDVRDIAEVAVRALTEEGHQGRTYVLTGAEALTQAEAAARFSSVLGRPVRYVDVPLEATRQAIEAQVTRAGMPAALVSEFVAMQQSVAEGRGAMVSHDFEKVTGHPPRRFDDFVRDSAAAFR